MTSEVWVWTSAQLRRDASHPRATEAVEHDVARLGVVEDVPHDRLVRHLGVVAVGVVDRVVSAFADVCCEGLTAVLVACLVVCGAVLRDELG